MAARPMMLWLTVSALISAALLEAAAASRQRSSNDSAAERYATGIAFHLQRCLDEAGREYDAALRLDPPREPTPAEWTRVERFAPRIHVTTTEPFGLRDVAVVIRPADGLLAYHLFWDDDIDFPDDNEPADHEVVWVEPSADGTTLDAYWTYFHGRILAATDAAVTDARRHAMRPRVNVQWGKHGTLPQAWENMPIQPESGETEEEFQVKTGTITLREYNDATFRRLSTVGRRVPDNPIARRLGWPERFAGRPEEFNRFDRVIEPLELLRSRRLVLVSSWNNAVLNREFLPYNFRPKIGWPDERSGLDE